jgi:uncharacterized membrane protein YjjP (DUF1212 family)
MCAPALPDCTKHADTGRVTDPTPPRWRTALWRGETAPIPVVRTPTRAVYPRRRPGDDIELTAVDQGASLALRVGTLLLAGGAPTEDVEAAIFAVGTALGLGTFEVDITYKSIIISVAPTGDRPSYTDIRVVRGRAMHFARVAAAHQLVIDLAEGRLAPTEVEARLSEIEHLRRPYPRWFVVLAFGALSAAITVQLGGSAMTALVAFLTAAVTGLIGLRMIRRHAPTFFVNLVVAFGSAAIAVGVKWLEPNIDGFNVNTSLIIVGGIIALLPGMTLMVAAQEAIGSFAVTAAARFVELTFATVGIVSGVLLGLVLADKLDISMNPDMGLDTNALLTVSIAAIAAAVAAASAATTYQSPARLVVAGALIAGVAMLVYDWSSDWTTTAGVAAAAPAVVIGFLGAVVAGRFKVPPVLITAAGIVPLLPGLAVYQGLLNLSENDIREGLQYLVVASTIAIALAAGVLLGQLLAGRLMRSPLRAFIPQWGQTRDRYR